ncbi:MAG: acetate--CoA ligase family protein [Rhodospirillales bacterium]|nr:acetate--CoA ligase family protein [Rhodospirillales bacterium]
MNDLGIAPSRRVRLKRALAPERIAFVGGGWVEAGIAYLHQLGFEGDVAVVNPRRDRIGGLPCVPSLDALPFVPDVAFVCVNRERTLEIVPELRALGAAAVVCNAAGFAEIGKDGALLQDRLAEAAGEMPVFGPNCPGFVNFQVRAAVMMERFGLQDPGVGTALVTQGGGVMLDLLSSMRDVPLTHMIGLGNQMDVTIPECMDIVLDDARVRALAVYVEGLPDVPQLCAVAHRALRQGVPIVLMKAGASDAGARAMFSHTASLTSPEAVNDALFDRLGILRVGDLPEMTETLKMLTVAGIPSGKRTAIVTASGMHSSLAGDEAERCGLDVALPSETATDALGQLLPDIATPGNPLDLTTVYWGQRTEQADCYRPLLADGYDVALNVCNYPRPGIWEIEAWRQEFLGFADVVAETGVKGATVTIFPESFPEDAKRLHVELGIAPLQGLREGMQAVANAVRYGALRRACLERSDEHILLASAPPSAGPVMTLGEHEAKQRAAASGLRIPESIVVERRDASAPAIPFDGPYVVKLANDAVLHKSDLGAVVVDIPDGAGVAAAMDAIAASVRAHDPGIATDRFLVESFVSDAVAELLVGVTRIEHVGLAMTLATGGTMTELIADRSVVLLPADPAGLERAFDGLAAASLCRGFRSAVAGDRQAVLGAIAAIAAVACEIGPDLVELEVNPLLIRPRDQGAVAVDMVLRQTGTPMRSAS